MPCLNALLQYSGPARKHDPTSSKLSCRRAASIRRAAPSLVYYSELWIAASLLALTHSSFILPARSPRTEMDTSTSTSHTKTSSYYQAVLFSRCKKKRSQVSLCDTDEKCSHRYSLTHLVTCSCQIVSFFMGLNTLTFRVHWTSSVSDFSQRASLEPLDDGHLGFFRLCLQLQHNTFTH